MRHDALRLHDILSAIEAILRRVPASFEDFEASELLRTWVLFHLLIIGEAANTLSPALCEQHPAIPWRKICGMRHFVIHEYFDIDLTQIWAVMLNDLPELKSGIQQIISALDTTSSAAD